jgi:hypothetical protein
MNRCKNPYGFLLVAVALMSVMTPSRASSYKITIIPADSGDARGVTMSCVYDVVCSVNLPVRIENKNETIKVFGFIKPGNAWFNFRVGKDQLYRGSEAYAHIPIGRSRTAAATVELRPQAGDEFPNPFVQQHPVVRSASPLADLHIGLVRLD